METTNLTQSMTHVHLMRIEEMPQIELYLDQVLTLVTEGLQFMAAPDETLLTGSMVNNYVKQHVVPAPRKKRYTRRHLAHLLFVTAFKRVFSIAEVSQMLELTALAGVDEAALYDEACTTIELAVAARFGGADVAEREAAAGRLAEVATADVARILVAAADSLASKIYVEKTLGAALAAAAEKPVEPAPAAERAQPAPEGAPTPAATAPEATR